jgi:enoyl-CoA hydratase/carnithine racemase
MSFVDVALDGHVATVTLSRPEALNALSGEMADQVGGAFLQAAAQPDTWVIVLAAAGDEAFCVGADLKERNQLDDRGWHRNRIFMKGMFEAIRSVPQPTIASVFGYALGGGCELALSCDLIVASDDAVFGLPEVRVGIVPGGGGTQLLAPAWASRGPRS